MRVASADGVELDVAVRGAGPVVVLVSGALDDGAELRPLAELLARSCTAVLYARRGRGASGDVAGSTVDDEVEDLRAVIRAASEDPVAVLGASSGGILALRAAAAGVAIARLALWEVPFDLAEGAAERHRTYREALARALDVDDRDAALALAMRAWGSPPDVIDAARRSPFWTPLLQLAPTLRHDADVMGDGTLPVALLQGIRIPVLVATSTGTATEMADLPDGFFAAAADGVVGAIPDAERITVPQRGHELDADAVGAAIGRFLRDGLRSEEAARPPR